MARRKKQSATLEKAQKRLAGLKSIDAKVDLGNGLTVASYEKEINEVRQKIEAYNTLLSKVDDAANTVQTLERELSVAAENVLLAVKLKYGKDSSEYEMVGGTRQSERRRPKAPSTDESTTA